MSRVVTSARAFNVVDFFSKFKLREIDEKSRESIRLVSGRVREGVWVRASDIGGSFLVNLCSYI